VCCFGLGCPGGGGAPALRIFKEIWEKALVLSTPVGLQLSSIVSPWLPLSESNLCLFLEEGHTSLHKPLYSYREKWLRTPLCDANIMAWGPLFFVLNSYCSKRKRMKLLSTLEWQELGSLLRLFLFYSYFVLSFFLVSSFMSENFALRHNEGFC
jgi:hypothetical protein